MSNQGTKKEKIQGIIIAILSLIIVFGGAYFASELKYCDQKEELQFEEIGFNLAISSIETPNLLDMSFIFSLTSTVYSPYILLSSYIIICINKKKGTNPYFIKLCFLKKLTKSSFCVNPTIASDISPLFTIKIVGVPNSFPFSPNVSTSRL